MDIPNRINKLKFWAQSQWIRCKPLALALKVKLLIWMRFCKKLLQQLSKHLLILSKTGLTLLLRLGIWLIKRSVRLNKWVWAWLGIRIGKWLNRFSKYFVQSFTAIQTLVRRNFTLVLSTVSVVICGISAFYTYKSVALTEQRSKLDTEQNFYGIEPKFAQIRKNKKNWKWCIYLVNKAKGFERAWFDIELTFKDHTVIDKFTPYLNKEWQIIGNRIIASDCFSYGTPKVIAVFNSNIVPDDIINGCKVILQHGSWKREFRKISFERPPFLK